MSVTTYTATLCCVRHVDRVVTTQRYRDQYPAPCPNKISLPPFQSLYHHAPDDLKTRKRTGTSCQIEIHISI